MSNWDEFYRLDTLKVSFLDSQAAKSAAIFANGKNQVALNIQVKILGKDNTLNFTEAELIKKIKLVNFSNGKALDSSWIYSSTSKGYVGPYQYLQNRDVSEENLDDSLAERTELITLYLSVTTPLLETDVAVEIDIPNVGAFNTTANGTSTINGGSVFRSPSYVHVSSLIPKIYSSGIEHFTIEGMPKNYDELDTVVSNMPIYTTGGSGVVYNKQYDGASSKKLVNITLSDPKFYIKKIQTNGGTVKNKKWNIPGNGCADIVYGDWGKRYDIEFLFINKSENGLLQNSILTLRNGKTYQDYHILSDDKRHVFNNTPKDHALQIFICNHRLPFGSGFGQHDWVDSSNQEVTITDNYGNESVITIRLDGYSWPSFKINGVKTV